MIYKIWSLNVSMFALIFTNTCLLAFTHWPLSTFISYLKQSEKSQHKVSEWLRKLKEFHHCMWKYNCFRKTLLQKYKQDIMQAGTVETFMVCCSLLCDGDASHLLFVGAFILLAEFQSGTDTLRSPFVCYGINQLPSDPPHEPLAGRSDNSGFHMIADVVQQLSNFFLSVKI